MQIYSSQKKTQNHYMI